MKRREIEGGFSEAAERWLDGTNQNQRDRYLAVLRSYAGTDGRGAREALLAADLGASSEVLDELAEIISRSPIFRLDEAGGATMQTHDGKVRRFKRITHFGGSSN